MSEPNPETPDNGKDRRRFKRVPTLFSGAIDTGAGTTVSVAVLDVSVNGAKLRLREPFEPSGPFVLCIDRLGIFHAEAVWRKGNRIGVRFLEAPDDVSEVLPETFAERLRRGLAPS